jgi:four helix bundle protein
VHKLKVCLKELRETKRWLRLVVRVPMLSSNVVNPLLQETIELIRIFAASIRTAEQRGGQAKGRAQ